MVLTVTDQLLAAGYKTGTGRWADMVDIELEPSPWESMCGGCDGFSMDIVIPPINYDDDDDDGEVEAEVEREEEIDCRDCRSATVLFSMAHTDGDGNWVTFEE